MSCRKAQGERPTPECYDSVHSVPLDHTPGPGPFAASPHRWVPVHTQPASCSWPQTWRHRLVTPCPTTPRSHRSPHRSPDQGQNTRLGSQHLYPPSCLSRGQLLRVCSRMPPDGSWELSSGHQPWWQALLLSEPFCQPYGTFLLSLSVYKNLTFFHVLKCDL